MLVDRLRSLPMKRYFAYAALACLASCASGTRSPRRPQQPASAAGPSNDALKSRGTDESDANAAASTPSADEAPRSEAAPSPRAAAPAAPSPGYGQESSYGYGQQAPGAVDPHSPAGRARVRLSEARRELDIAASDRDCARACRALESMERAAQQVCELARSAEERGECASATAQVEKARDRVNSACGSCPRKAR
jgi:hypothetical protein